MRRVPVPPKVADARPPVDEVAYGSRRLGTGVGVGIRIRPARVTNGNTREAYFDDLVDACSSAV